MRKLPYTDKEICKSYMQNPCAKQVGVLSELNDCKAHEILNVLASYGIKVGAEKKKPEKKKEKTLVVWKNRSNPTLINYIRKRKIRLAISSDLN